MRILCEIRGGNRRKLVEGWGRVFGAAGHEFVAWEPREKPTFDAFDEVDPHLFIRGGPPLRPASKCIAGRPHLAVSAQVDPEPAADTFFCEAAATLPGLACDFAYVGTGDEDAGLLDSYVLPLAGRGKLKAFSVGPWACPYHLGYLDDITVRSVYMSATVSLHVSASGRAGQGVYDTLLCGGLCVSNELKHSSIPGDVVLRGLTPPEFHQLATTLLDPRLRRWRAAARKRGREIVLGGHTYWHRCEEILRGAGFAREADKLMEVYRATVRV